MAGLRIVFEGKDKRKELKVKTGQRENQRKGKSLFILIVHEDL